MSFFDTISPQIITIIGAKMGWEAVRLLMQCSKRLRAALSMNHVWRVYSELLPEFGLIHPKDLERQVPEGFWNNWWIERMPRKLVRKDPELINGPSGKFYRPFIGSLVCAGNGSLCIIIDFKPITSGPYAGVPAREIIAARVLDTRGDQNGRYSWKRKSKTSFRVYDGFLIGATYII